MAKRAAAPTIRPLPVQETLRENGDRYVELRRSMSMDEAQAAIFRFYALQMAEVRPEWTAERIAQELRDRGYGQRYGYHWTLRTAAEALATRANE